VKFTKEHIAIGKPFCLNNKPLWTISKVCCYQCITIHKLDTHSKWENFWKVLSTVVANCTKAYSICK